MARHAIAPDGLNIDIAKCALRRRPVSIAVSLSSDTHRASVAKFVVGSGQSGAGNIDTERVEASQTRTGTLAKS